MPLPTPKKGESEDNYLGRCMDKLEKDDSKLEQDERLAACYDKYRKEKSSRNNKNRKKKKKKDKGKRLLKDSKALAKELTRLRNHFNDKYHSE